MEENIVEAQKETTPEGNSPQPVAEAVMAEAAQPQAVTEKAGTTLQLEPVPGLTLRERMALTFEPVRERLARFFSPLGRRLGSALRPLQGALGNGRWVYDVIAALLIIAMILPPIALPRRLGLVGYTLLNAARPLISHPDGLTLSLVNPSTLGPDGSLAGTATVTGRLRVRIDSVPRLNFLEGSAGSQLRQAAQAIPNYLQLKSPYYKIAAQGRPEGPFTLEVVIPNDAEPWETLDLYTWDGESWQWLGGTLDPEREVLTVELTEVPPSVAVMQTLAVVPVVGSVATERPQGQMTEVLNDVHMPGLYLGTDGLLLGQAAAAEVGSNPVPFLLLRNWREGEPVNSSLLTDILTLADIQQTHIDNIAAAAAAGYGGVTLDYRGVAPEQREAFSRFVAALANALHAQNLRLQVIVPAPLIAASGWDTGGYDWAALGRAADTLFFPLPDDPAAYSENGRIVSLLRWAVGQVNRYKLRGYLSSLSADIAPTQVRHVSLEEALAAFDQVRAPGEGTLTPGQEVLFSLAGRVTNILIDESAGTYGIVYQADDGTQHTAWLGTPSFLARKLDWLLRYHLVGVVVADLADVGNMPGVVEAVNGYRQAASLPQPAQLLVSWTVEEGNNVVVQQGFALNQPDFRWVAPETPGTYLVSASIAGISRGSAQLTVATPAPQSTPTPTPQPPATNTAMSMQNPGCLRAYFETDVTIPDGTRVEKGATFTKTWRLRNNGTCDWPADTVLVNKQSQLGGTTAVPVGAVAVGQSVEISVELTAPTADGNYKGSWVLMAGGTEIPNSIVTAVVRVGEATVAAPPPAPVAGGSFEMGGHIRDLSFPYADLMHYAGMTWAKVQVPYGADASGIIQAAHARGFKIQLSALGSPGMVTQPGFEQQYAAWVAGLAAQGADAIEVWNEPNIDREWQGEYINPQAYTNLLCAAYQAIKARNPGTAVISAAPSPTGWFSQAGGAKTSNCNDNVGCGYDDQPWMEGLYNAGAANCMDYIGAHHNAGATSPSARSGHPTGSLHHSWYFLPQTELYYNIFRGTRKIFYTEMGYASQEGVPTFSDDFAWARGTNNAQQAAWLAEAASLGANTGMVRCIIVWNIDFVRYGYDPQDGYAIVRPGGSCPACDALHNVLGTR